MIEDWVSAHTPLTTVKGEGSLTRPGFKDCFIVFMFVWLFWLVACLICCYRLPLVFVLFYIMKNVGFTLLYPQQLNIEGKGSIRGDDTRVTTTAVGIIR